jgi:hypothetical protein
MPYDGRESVAYGNIISIMALVRCIITIIVLIIPIVFSGCYTERKSEATGAIITEQIPVAKSIEANDCTDPAKTEAAASAIEGTLKRFPDGFTGLAGIEAIYICEGLTNIGVPSPAATARIEGKTCIYIDAASAVRTDYSFTHELFHAIELRFPVDEEEWGKINPYEPYLKDLAKPGDVVPYIPNKIPAFEPGFATDYARFSAAEDRAELFAVMYSGSGLNAKERTAMLCDPFLMEKAEYMKGYLKGYLKDCMEDNLLSIETNYTCRTVYSLTNPGLALTGPSEKYPPANLKAGARLAYSGFEKDGIKMLYDENFRRVYAPPEALELLEDETVSFSRPSSCPK